ncbi:MAG: TetR/AcrR family transcriptional regulator [Eubacteriales bacterium]
MQTIKEETKEKLLLIGKKEFLSKGFLGASLRKIVKDADTTIGNYYNYFENKEALFKELVQGEYESFTHFIQHHDEIGKPDFLWETMDINQWRQVLEELITPMMPSLSINFILLIEGSKGTQYEGTKKMLVQLLANHFTEHMKKFNPDHVDKEFAHIIALQLLNGFIHIIKTTSNHNLRKHLLRDYLLFYFIGSMGMMGIWN